MKGTTAMLVNTEAVMKARVTTGTSKYHASSGNLAAPSIVCWPQSYSIKERSVALIGCQRRIGNRDTSCWIGKPDWTAWDGVAPARRHDTPRSSQALLLRTSQGCLTTASDQEKSRWSNPSYPSSVTKYFHHSQNASINHYFSFSFSGKYCAYWAIYHFPPKMSFTTSDSCLDPAP